MKFIDALYKYDEITRDNKEIYYYMNNIIYMRTEGLDEVEVALTLRDMEELMEYTDWREYSHEAIPRVPEGDLYYYLSSTMEVLYSMDCRTEGDRESCISTNYFTNKEDAQHLANVFKRLSLIINTKRYDTERDIQEIIDYIDNEYPILKRDIDNYNREYIL